jgi:hypothetical protein
MSLENALQENTAAIRDLIAAMQGAPVAAPVVAEPKAEAPAKTEKKAKAEKAETPKVEAAATPEPKEEVAPVADEDAPDATYQDAAQAITALSKIKGRDAAVALLKKFGASKLPEVKPEDFNAIVAAANEQAQA